MEAYLYKKFPGEKLQLFDEKGRLESLENFSWGI